MNRYLISLVCILLSLSAAGQIKVVGHRGVRHNTPQEPATIYYENTIPALEYCQGLGIYAAEFDIQLTKDEKIIVFHGTNVPGLNRSIHDLSFDEARAVVLPGGSHMPTIEEWFAQAKKHPETKLICEIKIQSTPERETKAVELVLDAVHRMKMEDQIEYTTFSDWMAQEFHRLDPGCKVLFLDSGVFVKSPEYCKERGYDAISYDMNGLMNHPDYVQRAHKLGMEVTIWIVNDNEVVDWAIRHGVDYVSSDHPERIKSYLERKDFQTWEKGPAWLENAVIYQVYPSSYKDSDGNGIGDIPGVLSKLDYIEKLGVSVIWFNPLFESGWIDGGYDVKDYYKVDPRFGTNTDLVKLIDECHKRGIKLFLDLVPGHTSMDHPWFKQSKEADANQQYSDYYIWSDRLPDAKAKDELARMMKQGNIWQNTTGKWMDASYLEDAERAKFYMKNFYACQPALNFGYANPNPANPWEQGVDDPGPKAVKQELKDIISFWFGKGVDGFRVDMAASLIKNDKDKKGILAFWREIRAWMDREYPDHVLMAEWGDPKHCLAAGFNVDMYLNAASRSNTVRKMYFDHKHQADGGCYFSLNGCKPSTMDLYGNPWPEDKIDASINAAQALKKYYDYYSEVTALTKDMGYFASITGNHDHLRFNTGARNNPQQLKVALAWILTQQLPILYYGDEIGIRSLADLPNVEGANHNGKERAGGRTPMQWDGSANAGFSTCEAKDLYLPVCPEWTPATSYPLYLKWKEEGCRKPTAKGAITVESQDNDPQSLLNWTRALISLRKETKAFWGSSEWTPIYNEDSPYPMVYTRSDGNETFLVALNPTAEKKTVNIPSQTSFKAGTALTGVLMSGKGTYKVTAKGDVIALQPTSAMIVKVK